jgi:hypothetical protein
MEEDSDFGICDVCGEFDCEIDHSDDDSNDIDDDWMFDGSGMVGDD